MSPALHSMPPLVAHKKARLQYAQPAKPLSPTPLVHKAPLLNLASQGTSPVIPPYQRLDQALAAAQSASTNQRSPAPIINGLSLPMTTNQHPQSLAFLPPHVSLASHFSTS